jgi:hypothetical protein
MNNSRRSARHRRRATQRWRLEARRARRRTRRRQTGGKWLSEGADGCVFTAPHNWPCASFADLPTYNPEDPTVVTKIVEKKDTEGSLLQHLNQVRSLYRLPNLPEYLGSCTPKTTAFLNNNRVGFEEHLRNIQKTRKGCGKWRTNLQSGFVAGRKMYVLRKYSTTLGAYTEALRKKQADGGGGGLVDRIARIFASSAPAFLHTLSVLANGKPYRVIHYDLHTKNIALYPKPGRTFDPFDTNTFSIGPTDFGRSVWRDMRLLLTEATAAHWDEPFLQQFVLRKKSKLYWDFNQFSLENRLMSFIAQTPAKPADKLWLEAWATDANVAEGAKTSKDPVLLSLPTLLSVLPGSRKWRAFEANLEYLVRQLQGAGDSPASRFAVLQKSPSLRLFFDALKGRSMLPVALGLYLRNALLAMGLEQHDVAMAFSGRNEFSFKKIHPAMEVLVPVFNRYWNMLLRPYSA